MGRHELVTFRHYLLCRIIELNDLACHLVSGVLRHVNDLTDEARRGVTRRGGWEQKLVQLHSS